jgi:hypothetical protein
MLVLETRFNLEFGFDKSGLVNDEFQVQHAVEDNNNTLRVTFTRRSRGGGEDIDNLEKMKSTTELITHAREK